MTVSTVSMRFNFGTMERNRFIGFTIEDGEIA